ncbi:hypothetical protein [Bradyrhizobium sp. LMG 9283]|uniref:hypothetical protein n=1 Tax=Bradyrhizobium sp. LMG 9283 TaxID=592064 RepID=UPI00388FEAEA
MAKRIRARVQETRHVRPHNDLDGAALYLQKIIRDKLAAKIQDNLFYDCMACSTMIAFTFEAYLNFFGAELVESWDEWWGIDKKEKTVFRTLKFKPDWKVRPFSSMRAMKELRNIFAHAKPQTFEMDEVVEADVGELDGKRYDIGPQWEKDCMPEPVLAAYDDLKVVWRTMFEASGLTMFAAMDHGDGGITFIEHVN